MRMREAMREINQARGSEDLALNIGLHEGPCLAVVLDERQDYFGQIGQHRLARAGARRPDRDPGDAGDRRDAGGGEVDRGAQPIRRFGEKALKGVSEALTVYQIRDGFAAAA